MICAEINLLALLPKEKRENVPLKGVQYDIKESLESTLWASCFLKMK